MTTIILAEARSQFDELVWTLAQNRSFPIGSGAEARDICKALWGSTDITPDGAQFDDLNEMLDAIDAVPKKRTYGAYAKSMLRLLDSMEAATAAERASEIDDTISQPATDLAGIAAKIEAIMQEQEAENDVIVQRGLTSLKADIARLIA